MLAKSRLIGLGLLLLALATVAPAQVEDVPVGDMTLEKAAKKIKERFIDATKASDTAPTKEHLAALEVAAQYYVFRLTWPEYADNPDKMAGAIREFNLLYKQRVLEILIPADNRETVVAFHKALKDCFKKVLVEREFAKNRLTSVNVAQLLPVLGKSKKDEISDMLTGLINEPAQSDTVKLFAMRGVKEFFPIADPTGVAPKAEDVKRVQALTGYIERTWDIKGLQKNELEAIAYLRREAIRCLGQSQVAAVGFQRKQVLGQTACTLLRVLAKDTLVPPPTLTEKCAAAFALCNIQTPVRDYHPDLAIYAVATTLGEFFVAYQNDQANIKKKGPELPWKALSEEWKSSLDNLFANTKAKVADKGNLNVRKALDAIYAYGTPSGEVIVDFRNNDVPKLRPKTASVIPFKDTESPDKKSLAVNLHYE